MSQDVKFNVRFPNFGSLQNDKKVFHDKKNLLFHKLRYVNLSCHERISYRFVVCRASHLIHQSEAFCRPGGV
jgi:hypothetical protein